MHWNQHTWSFKKIYMVISQAHRIKNLAQRLHCQVTEAKNKKLSYKEMESSQVNFVRNHTK